MGIVITIVWWLLTLLTALLTLVALGGLASGKVLPVILFSLGLGVAVPLLQPWLQSKLAFLKNGILRLLLWFVLTTAGTLFFGGADLPSLREVSLCEALSQGVCQQDGQVFGKNTKTLYVTGTPKNLPNDLSFKLDLKYSPEPGKDSVLETTTVKGKVNNDKLVVAFNPKALPVGAYILALNTEQKGTSITANKTFTVWDSDQDVQERRSGKLKTDSVDFGKLILCDRTQGDSCKVDSSSFKAEMKAIGFRLDVKAAKQDASFKITWKYLSGEGGKPVVLSSSTKTMDNRTGWIDYSLTSQQGFNPGNYELLVGLETANAKPIYRAFTVKE